MPLLWQLSEWRDWVERIPFSLVDPLVRIKFVKALVADSHLSPAIVPLAIDVEQRVDGFVD